MNYLKLKNNELIKHTSAIHISNTISVIERKISNILLKKAFAYLSTRDKHFIYVKEIIHLLGWSTDNNYEVIKNALKKLNTTQIEWNILKKDKKNEWGVTTIISGVKVKNGICEYSYSPVLKDLLAIPNIYAKLNMIVQAKFNSKHSLALWEFLVEILCSANSNCITTNWIELCNIRKILGVEEAGMYEEFKVLNRDVLKKATAEINNISDIEVECRHKRYGKKIIAIAFVVSRKQDFDYLSVNSEGNETESLDIACSDLVIDQNENSNGLIDRLKIEFNIPCKTAQKVVKDYNKEKIEKTIEYVKEQIANKKVNKIPAYFISALKEDWNLEISSVSNNLCNDSAINSEVEVHLQSQESPWKEILIYLRDWHGTLVYHTWFTKIMFVDYNKENNLLNIKANTTFYRDWIYSNYNQDILKASQLVIPQIRDIQINQ